MKHRIARLWARQQIVTGALLVSAGILLGTAVLLLDVLSIIPGLEVSDRDRSLIRVGLASLLVLTGAGLGIHRIVKGQMALMSIGQRALVGDIHRRIKRLESKLDRQDTERFAFREAKRRRLSREVAEAAVPASGTTTERARERHEPVT